MAGPDDPNVGLIVRYTFRAFTRVLATLVSPHGLTSAEFRVLRTLATDGVLTQVQLAARAGMDRPYAALVVKQLRQKALVGAQADPHDGRRVNLTLSARGHGITAGIAERLGQVNRSSIEGVSARDFATFVAVMERIRTNLEAIDAAPPAASPSLDKGAVDDHGLAELS